MLKSLEDEKTKSKYSKSSAAFSKQSSARSSVPSILKNGNNSNRNQSNNGI